MHNKGNYIVSLANVVRWLGQQAEALGVQIFPGFPAAGYIIEDDRVTGVRTGEFGIAKDGSQKEGYQPSMEIKANYILLAEGCRGHLSEQLMAEFNLREECDPQTYGIGLKEVWELDPSKHEEGKITHTVGWPLDKDTYGGSFMYHMENNQLSVGFVVGLDYQNPYLDPFMEFQRFKTHPKITPIFEGARRLSYGARALNEGGFQSIPKLTFPGGAIIGCSAGFMNVPKIKGTHTAMKSGMLAAEAVFVALDSNEAELVAYPKMFKESWVWDELYGVRNIRPGFHKGLWKGMLNAAMETYIRTGKGKTLHHHTDHAATKPASEFVPIEYPKPDGKLTFDRLSSVFVSNTNHEEDQPLHLTMRTGEVHSAETLNHYAGIQARFCPAGVYEIMGEGEQAVLQINAQNCVHCKTCDIKDPTQQIKWVTPEGGGGPNYGNM
jgi:electron-transferring-flavoprotein dehydrogenase